MSYVALIGNPSEGYSIRGPYVSFATAAAANEGPGVWIMELHHDVNAEGFGLASGDEDEEG